MRNDLLERKDEILNWIAENQSKAFIAKQLNCKQETLSRYLTIMGIDYAGNQSGKGKEKSKSKWNFEEYIANSKDIQSDKIRKKILEEGILPYKCNRCKNTTWLNAPIPLELHHIDGNKNHNELSNYELLCPNCHALTDNYCGKNIPH